MSARSWSYLAAVVAGGLALLVVQGVVPAAERAGCSGASVPLVVSSSTEKQLLLKQLANEYTEGNHRLADGRCASVTVDGFTSGAAMEALAVGWTPALAQNRPRPQVWLPTSSLWLTQLRARSDYAAADRLVTDPPSIARSPLVIAMTRQMAQQIGWPSPLTWRDVLGLDRDVWAGKGHPEWGPFTYAKDDPSRSTSGLAATIATYYAAAGKSQGLTPGDVASRPVTDFVRQVEANVLYHPADIVDFLQSMDDIEASTAATGGVESSYVSAVVMQEQLLYLHNQGNPGGDPELVGPGGSKAKPSGRPFVAIHPADGTIVLDHPYVVLPDADQAQQAAAASFLEYLKQGAQQKKFAALGFRDSSDVPSPELAQSLAVPAGQRPKPFGTPSAEIIDRIRAGWRQLSKQANVLVVVNASGSMNSPSGIPGRGDRMDAAKAALRGNARLLGPEDQVGLWWFASDPRAPHAELLAPGRFGDGRAFTTAVDRLRVAANPYDDTALYVSIRDAHRYLLDHLATDRVNAVVVLSDGRNDYPADPYSVDNLIGDLNRTDPDHQVKVFGIGFGGDADLGTLKRISGTSGVPVEDATQSPELIDTAFASIFQGVSVGSS